MIPGSDNEFGALEVQFQYFFLYILDSSLPLFSKTAFLQK
jgi:hypothetical protein